MEDAAPEPAPDGLLALHVARRRATDVLGALETRRVQVIGRQHEVLRARLRKDPEAAPLSPSNLLHGIRGGDMHEQDGHVDDLGHGDGPVRALALHGLRPGRRVEVRRRPARALELLREPGDAVGVLRVHHHHGPLATGHGQHRDDLPVVELQGLVGHVDLERRVTLSDQRGQLAAQHVLGGIGNDQVKRVVDDGLPRRAAMVILDGGAHALSLELAREGHHGRRAAVRRRDRAREEIIGERDRVAHGLIEMAVRVDPARQHVAPGGVDLPPRGPEVPAERR